MHRAYSIPIRVGVVNMDIRFSKVKEYENLKIALLSAACMPINPKIMHYLIIYALL